MALLTISIPDSVLAAFEERYSPEQRAPALTAALTGLLDRSPYTAEQRAEDERRYQRFLATREALSTEQVAARLNAQLERAGLQ